MDVNITVPAGLDFLHRHKKLLVQLLIELIKNKASLCGYKGAVGIGVFLVPHIHDGLAFLIDIVHHTHEILFIIPVVPVAFRHNGLDFLKSALHNIVHNRNRNPVRFHLVHLIDDKFADMLLFLFRKLGKRPVSAFPYSVDYLLDVKSLQAPVLFNHHNFFLRLK